MGVWKMVAPSKTRIGVPPSFGYFIEKIREHVTEIEQLVESADFRDVDVTRYKIRLAFLGIENCCNVAGNVLEEERYHDES